jgi:isoleucyl-tRNA synthetase
MSDTKGKLYEEYGSLNLPEVDASILSYWKENNIFQKSIQNRPETNPFVFFEGPPSANGLPGIHHVMARTIKDIFCRYKTLQGFRVERKAGWDTHGLPVELGVEKELGITKEDIGKSISVEDYNEACKKAVMKYTDVWNNLTEKMGYWVNMEDPYVTYDPKYMETVWWLLKELHNKNLLYKGYTIQPYSPKAGTGLSSHELNQPGTYQDVSDTTVVAMFKSVKESLPEFLANYDDVYFLAWTTTPWTLPSNTALTVGKKIDYVLVQTFNQYTFEPIHVVLAKNLIGKVFSGKYEESSDAEVLASYNIEDKKIPYCILQEFKGADILESRYEQLIDYATPHEGKNNAFRVIAGDFVTTEDGTGIVHTAPTFGADDAKVASEANPPVPPMLVMNEEEKLVPLVDLKGRFRPEMRELAGKYVKNEYYEEGKAPEKSVDVEIAIDLKTRNRAFKVEKYVHSYPNCWRTDKPILYYPLDSWFIKVTDVKDRMYELNNTINWKPKSTGDGRFGNWLKNANDWNLSRSRYWGIPLPIWRTEDGKEEKAIGSVEELKTEIEKSVRAGYMTQNPLENFVPNDFSTSNYEHVDLHKNIVDEIYLVSDSGQKMVRESDLIDVWFDSGSMPYAQWHYPFENKDKIDQGKAFPADYIAEGVDQTRGWFYTLHAIGTMAFDQVAYKNVISNGLVLDANGNKMSKRLGNTVDPFTTLESHGADAVRWYMLANAQPWDNLKFDLKGVEETKRKFFGTLSNVYSFFALYANIDSYSYAFVPMENRTELDQWIVSKLNSLTRFVEESMDQYESTPAVRAIQEFTLDHLSNWFVRLSRRRFWKNTDAADKSAAYATLFECLEGISKLMSAFAPFYAERLYRSLKPEEESVHLSDFPNWNAAFINTNLEEKVEMAQNLTSLVLGIRKKEKFKVRQPLSRILVPIKNDKERKLIEEVKEIVLQEVNIKSIEFVDENSPIQIVKKAVPNFKSIGPRAGKNMRFVKDAVMNLGQDDMSDFETNGTLSISLANGEEFTLEPEDLLIHYADMPGWTVTSGNGLTLALDLSLTDELVNEGIARELVNRLQNLRKSKEFDVTDRIQVVLEHHPELTRAIEGFNSYIRGEILADSLTEQNQIHGKDVIEINEIEVRVDISKS